jgi:hypothetical protein
VAPTTATVWPGGHLEVQAAQHGHIGAVGKSHVAQGEGPAHLALRQLLVAVGQRVLRVQEVQRARGGRHGALVEVERLAQARERPEQALREEHHHRERADGQRPGERQLSACDERGDEAHHDDHADDGHERGAQLDGVLVDLRVALALLLQAAQLVRLVGEALDGADAAQVDGQAAVERAHLVAHPGVARHQQGLIAERAEQHERHGQERQHGHGRRQREEHRADHQHRGAHLDELVGAGVEEALQLVHVVVQHAHQLAGATLLEPGHVEGLHVVVELDAQLVLHVLCEVSPRHLEQVLEDRLEPPDDHREQRQHPQLVRGLHHPEAGDQGLLPSDHHVHRRAYQQRWREVEELVEERVGRRQTHPTAVRCGIGEEAPEGTLGRGGARHIR